MKGIQGLDANLVLTALIARFENMRPIWAATTLASFGQEMFADWGVPLLDEYLMIQAKLQGKQVHGVERPDEQCNLFNDMDTDLAIFALNETLSELELLRLGKVKENSHMKSAERYRQGTLDTTTKFFRHMYDKNASNAMVQKMEEFDTEILEKRNKRMVARIIELLREKPDAYFFALGVAHFIGEYNIPDMMRSAGFEVDHIGDITP